MNKYTMRESLCRAPLAVAVGSVLAGGSAHAATITVNTTDDIIIAGACSLRAAIESANTASSIGGCGSGSFGTDVINIDGSLSGGTITLSGELEITSSLEINGPVSGDRTSITISGNGNSRIFRAQGELGGVQNVTLSNMTLTNGSVPGDAAGGGSERGGAVLANNSNLSLLNSAVTSSTVGTPGSNNGSGGGVAVSNGNLFVTNSEISGNVASTSGGGVHVVNGSAQILATNVFSNRAVGGNGGGVSASSVGGALPFDVDIIGSSISGNFTGPEGSPGGGSGGGIDIFGSNLFVDRSTVGVNDSGGRGGGIAVSDGGIEPEVTIQNSTISSNFTEGDFAVGGGLFLRGLNSKLTANVTNSTITGNRVLGNNPNTDGTHGGGIYFHGPGGLALLHTTVTGNQATGTDGIHKYAPEGGLTAVLLDNSIMDQPGVTATACGASGVIDKPTFIASNTLATDDSCTGETTDTADISLGVLAGNGGHTQTHALGENSVAINAAGDCGNDHDIDEDQRGEPRPGKGSTACDIGAYEFQGEPEDDIFVDRFEEPAL